MNPLLLPWLAEIVLITYRGFANKEDVRPVAFLPVPADYAASFIIFGALSFAGGGLRKPAVIFGWGVVVATFLDLWDPKTGKISSHQGPTNVPGQTTQQGGQTA